MAMSKFKKPVPPPAAATKRQSRWADVKAAAPKIRMPNVGIYRFRVAACYETAHPKSGRLSVKTYLDIVEIYEGGEGHAVDERVFCLQFTSGDGMASGLGKVKAFVMNALGYDDEDAYDEHDPKGELLDAVLDSELANERREEADTLIGRLVDAQVARGNDTADGKDWYREYEWAPVAEEEQG